MLLGIAAAAIAEGAGRAARPRSVAAESDKGRLMSVYDTARDKLRAHDRNEPTDNRPPLVAHDVSDAADGPLIAFYDPDGNTMDGEIIYTSATVDVERNR